jgi:hypothetical protein
MIRKEGINISDQETRSHPEMCPVSAEVSANDYLGSEVETICTFTVIRIAGFSSGSSSLSNKSLPARGEKVYLVSLCAGYREGAPENVII